jgi:hypothetical protein
VSRRRRDGREVAQKGKSRKRGRDWHTRVEWVELPEVGSGADPASGSPTPLRQGHAKQWRERQRRDEGEDGS